MAKFDPRSLTKEQLDRAVKSGKLTDYYFEDNTLIKEIATRGGGYVLKLIEFLPDTGKEHIQMDFIYDSQGNLIDERLHKF